MNQAAAHPILASISAGVGIRRLGGPPRCPRRRVAHRGTTPMYSTSHGPGGACTASAVCLCDTSTARDGGHGRRCRTAGASEPEHRTPWRCLTWHARLGMIRPLHAVAHAVQRHQEKRDTPY